MAEYLATFDVAGSDAPREPVRVPSGTLVSDAARLAGVEIGQPCGGQGRCGRCAVQIASGSVRRRSTVRLSPEDIAAGWGHACQAVIEGDVTIYVPPQEQIERRLTTDRTAAEVRPPEGYHAASMQTVRRAVVVLNEPSMDDQTDDWARLQTALRLQAGIEGAVQASLPVLQKLGPTLRDAGWIATAVLETDTWDRPAGPAGSTPRLIDVRPGREFEDEPLWGIAVDIGTTTVTVWLVDLTSGEVRQQISEYNGQISRGEDVISRVIAASKNGGRGDLKKLVLDTINELVETVCVRQQIQPADIVKATVAGNNIMIHLLLGIPADSIRLKPFVPVVNHIPSLAARDMGLAIHPEASVDCLPGVASYVGADITAGVLSSGTDDADLITLFIDVGTNGEMVMGNRDWLVTCACSAGPAFEGAGVVFGMRANRGAIEEAWINGDTYEPSYRVIGGVKPRGICGSGLISLLAEMFLTGVLDKAGNINLTLPTNRVREGAHGGEYVVAWADETAEDKDIVITRVDVDNLLRAKAAIFAGFLVLAESVGLTLDVVEQVLIGGSFGKYINVEKAIQIGLLPDLPWEKFQFLGNTSVKGAYLALLDRASRQRVRDIAAKMTYLELSADNLFYDAFMSAMFLPHTDLSRFPNVEAALANGK